MIEEQNPYAAPQVESLAHPTPTAVDSDAERIRRAYLNHEASVQSIGLLFYVGGGLLVLGIVFGLIYTIGRSGGGAIVGVGIVVLAVYGALAAMAFVLGRGLQTLHRYVRIPVVILCSINVLLALFGIVAGGGAQLGALVVLAINGYVLYLLLSSKGNMVFSAQYAEIRRQTPQIKYRTSWIVRIAAIVLLAFLGLGVIGALVSAWRIGR